VEPVSNFGWWVTDALDAHPMLLVSWVFWVIFSITLHELAHGWAAIRRGDRTPIELGHMTMNPIVHMGPFSLVVFAVVGIAWGAMPINPSRLRGRHAEAFVAVAGPMMNISLALVAGVATGVLLRYTEPTEGVLYNLWIFCSVGCWLNLLLAGFNLVPAPPLDGSRIFASFVPAYRRLVEGEHAMALMILVFALVFLGGFDWLIAGSMEAGAWWSALVARALP
jgi:Zn-dependent protease